MSSRASEGSVAGALPPRTHWQAVILAALVCMGVGVSLFDGEWSQPRRAPVGLLLAFLAGGRLAWVEWGER
jgi:hypothetical protein